MNAKEFMLLALSAAFSSFMFQYMSFICRLSIRETVNFMLVCNSCVSFRGLPCFMFKLFQLLMCIAITILSVNEVEEGCALIYRSHSGSKSWGEELGAI
jgi:hypothetical protein